MGSSDGQLRWAAQMGSSDGQLRWAAQMGSSDGQLRWAGRVYMSYENGTLLDTLSGCCKPCRRMEVAHAQKQCCCPQSTRKGWFDPFLLAAEFTQTYWQKQLKAVDS